MILFSAFRRGACRHRDSFLPANESLCRAYYGAWNFFSSLPMVPRLPPLHHRLTSDRAYGAQNIGAPPAQSERELLTFDWPRTRDENIHKSSGALLPVRAEGHVGDSDQSAKKIEWLEVSTYVAARDGALDQRIDRSLDLSTRTFIQLGGASDEGIQCRGDDVLGGNVIDEQQHPGAQRFDRGHGISELPFRRGQLLYLSAINGFDQRIACRKVAIESSRSNACVFGDIIQAGVCAGPGKRLLGDVQNALAIALRISPGPSPYRL